MQLVIRDEVGRQDDGSDSGRHDERTENPEAVTAAPVPVSYSRGEDQQPGRKNHQVDRRQCLQRKAGGEQQRVAQAPPANHAVESEQDERDEFHVTRLQVREPQEDVRVERRDRARRVTGGPASGPSVYEEAKRPTGDREAGEEDEAVRQNG